MEIKEMIKRWKEILKEEYGFKKVYFLYLGLEDDDCEDYWYFHCFEEEEGDYKNKVEVRILKENFDIVQKKDENNNWIHI